MYEKYVNDIKEKAMEVKRKTEEDRAKHLAKMKKDSLAHAGMTYEKFVAADKWMEPFAIERKPNSTREEALEANGSMPVLDELIDAAVSLDAKPAGKEDGGGGGGGGGEGA